MNQYQRGLSLIELMVSLALGLVITLGVTNIFISARATYSAQNSSAAMQEDARYLLSRLSQEIRMVGMYGCIVVVPNSASDLSTNQSFSTLLNNNAWITSTTNAAGTVLTLNTADVGGNGSGAPAWTVVSDCRSGATVYTGTPPQGAVAADQSSFPIRQTVYTYKSANMAIYTGTGNAQQVLVSNVSAFALSFGLSSTDADSDVAVTSYVNAVTVAQAARIRSVRISFTVTDPVGNANVAAGVADQRFSVTAALRNRML
ncbi:prepilin-type N-terminal cleavage/methylation domain-containing protein [Pseudomonas sp. KNUC1026]|uniref:prepilin-type N-terminal cleavage/methylation domain-containing protein n=1 Tax=Pseudomonas sp. KNUC1026 TaxID=2893890 RepID=UPI001F3C434B|nr:prepilin-type N-terminal cleavage/methylation domain-containing protein [Pseudomonas sp. KNUC1026]UFH48799.1 prepilin-type N-terminal cleavage/methylation domain-containing protein [Pseudomonas sp. KNUC1026]